MLSKKKTIILSRKPMLHADLVSLLYKKYRLQSACLLMEYRQILWTNLSEWQNQLLWNVLNVSVLQLSQFSVMNI
jgi:hypothetical protein